MNDNSSGSSADIRIMTDEDVEKKIAECEEILGMTVDEFLALRDKKEEPDTFEAHVLVALLQFR